MSYRILCPCIGFDYLLITIIECKVGEKILEVSTNNDHVCPGDTLTYECTVVGDGGGIIVWMGEFFSCPNGKREIELLHSDFTSGQARVYNTQTCNDGNVMGRIIRASAENGVFTSQLNVTLTSDTAGRSIVCAHDNGTTHTIGSLNLTTGLSLSLVWDRFLYHCIIHKSIDFASGSPPASISSATTLSQFYAIRAFIWNAHSPGCSAIHYNILASNCGSCPTTTNHTNVTCTDVPTDGSTCTFAVQTILSGNITGESNQVSVSNINVPGQ